MKLQRILQSHVKKAFQNSGLGSYPVMLQPSSKANFGHYQITSAMKAAKDQGKNPRELAAQVLTHLNLEGIAEKVEVAGPGFINIFLSEEFLSELGTEMLLDERLGVERQTSEIIPIDYPSANLAKEMHVGHLRASIIGDALNRILRFLGHDAFCQDHVGDWGTQFGMLITYMVEVEKTGSSDLNLSNLEQFYRNAKLRFDESETFADAARSCVVRLQQGDPEILQLWRKFVKISHAHCLAVYKKLGLLVDESNVKGESSYNDDLQPTVDELIAQGLAVDDDGAKVVFLDEIKNQDYKPTAFIVQKKDGGFLYSTSDLACIKYRVRQLKADRILYVVDMRQGLHFKQLFTTARKAGFATDTTKLEHISFGTMLGQDGRPFKTRTGGNVKLVKLLDEAIDRAAQVVRDKNPSLSEEEINKIAHAVGISSVKYADLSKNRTSDYVFNWDSMLSFEGNTAPYMQYAYTRIQSIIRKNKQAETKISSKCCVAAAEPEEKALLCLLLQFGEVLNTISNTYMPHYLANYLYQLASLFSRLYEKHPILKAEESVRNKRILLIQLTGKTLKQGLNLLGLEVLDRM